MTNHEANAIISLSRLADWEIFMDYVQKNLDDMTAQMVFIDATDAIQIARVQGACTALRNMTNIAETALKEESSDE